MSELVGSSGSRDHVAHMTIDVPISHEMAPVAKILLYHVTKDGETVADSVHVPVEQCLENKVGVPKDSQFSN